MVSINLALSTYLTKVKYLFYKFRADMKHYSSCLVLLYIFL